MCDDVDVDYLFLQVFVDQVFVLDVQGCGNILVVVGLVVIECGLVFVINGEIDVCIYMLNIGEIVLVKI